MIKKWTDKGWDDYMYWLTQDKKTIKKINNLIKDIDRNGYDTSGKPEQLSENLAGWWSCRIDDKNRLIFRIIDGAIEITQCRTHYNDK